MKYQPTGRQLKRGVSRRAYYYKSYCVMSWSSFNVTDLSAGTSLETAVIPTAQVSRFTLQYFRYYIMFPGHT